jgi:hypothetical protein
VLRGQIRFFSYVYFMKVFAPSGNFAKRAKVDRVVLNALGNHMAEPGLGEFYPSPARTALNVPCFEGLSPARKEYSTSPVIELSVSNFPLNTNVEKILADPRIYADYFGGRRSDFGSQTSVFFLVTALLLFSRKLNAAPITAH